MRPVVLVAWLVPLACGVQGREHEPTLDEALAQARAHSTLAVVHFRLPGRPLSDAMDAALPTQRLRALAPRLVHVRVDATGQPAAFARLCGGSPRRGGGLATCVVDSEGDTLGCSLGYLSEPALAAFLTDAESLRRALAQRGGSGSPEQALALAEHFARLGRRDIARARAEAVLAQAPLDARRTAAAVLARLAVADGDLTATRTWLAQTAADDPHAVLTRAMLHLAARAPRDALRDLENLAERTATPEPAATLLHLGHALHACGEDARALAALDRVCNEFAGGPEAVLAARAAVHVRSGDHGHQHEALPP